MKTIAHNPFPHFYQPPKHYHEEPEKASNQLDKIVRKRKIKEGVAEWMQFKKDKEGKEANALPLYFSIGLVISLLLVVLVFEYQTPVQNIMQEEVITETAYFEVEEIPLSQQAPPPKPKLSANVNIIEIPDDVVLQEVVDVDLDIDFSETTQIPDQKISEVVFEEAPEEEVIEEIFTIVEEKPDFPGGVGEFYQYVSKAIKYPAQARRMGISGRVFVQFVVEKDGSITQVEVVKGIGGGCDEEAKRVISASPKWDPGKQRGVPVRVRMVLPIVFKIA
ncbi:energy transducer TonB [Persicobacter diffluens]|uniref:Protein TonB n=1 Tax=Persicobacter diffluens TaxID=981 RepID=A0AAN5AIP3_9BACT|nr:protein TonB [Persicobacter diffluens]